MKSKNNKENGLKMLLSAAAVFGAVALFSGPASAFMPDGTGDVEVIKGDIPVPRETEFIDAPIRKVFILEIKTEETLKEEEARFEEERKEALLEKLKLEELKERERDFSSDGRCEKCEYEHIPPRKVIFPEDAFGEALIPPGRDGGTGVPTPRRVDNLTTPEGVVDMREGPEEPAQAKNAEFALPGLHDLSFAVEDGGKELKGADVLDLAVMGDEHFEAGQFKQTADGLELCF